ncbi:MAG: malate dehydrogenase [Candidatus Omnitrophica bacterium CG22_combo_CG10-13_8_21_14_all_43_16]|nr:MAG: malate dehydrogenase [Candidatus Omnitrophica bacterium CG22_combo_CG10-13_8_21_14_all_43_16]
MKIAVIGAGNVGAMVASRICDADLADVVLVDIVPGMAKGKALDISDVRPVVNSSSGITGSEDFKDIKDSDIVVITAGLARKPGMSRDDLLKKNSDIIKDLSLQIKKYCPSSIVIVVTNPLDVMTYLVMKTTGFNPKKVIGMAGVLDTARFINILREKNKDIDDDKFLMMGSHGDTMVPVSRSKKVSKEDFIRASELARNRGEEIVKYLGTGSAYFAPSASVFFMLKAIIKNEKNTMCASAYLEGQYNEKDVYAGVPVVLGNSGINKIIEIDLTEEEKKAFKESARQIREGIAKTL